jgi:hypothetical protein
LQCEIEILIKKRKGYLMTKKDFPQIYVDYEREETTQTTPSYEVVGGELWFD